MLNCCGIKNKKKDELTHSKPAGKPKDNNNRASIISLDDDAAGGGGQAPPKKGGRRATAARGQSRDEEN